MYGKGYQHYKENSIDTMTQEELLLTLYDELMKRLTRAELALEKKDYPAMEEAVDRSTAIVRYLSATLDMQYEIGRNLYRLYDFFCYTLARVKYGRNQTELQRVKRMAGELRDSFRTAAQNVASGK